MYLRLYMKNVLCNMINNLNSYRQEIKILVDALFF